MNQVFKRGSCQIKTAFSKDGLARYIQANTSVPGVRTSVLLLLDNVIPTEFSKAPIAKKRKKGKKKKKKKKKRFNIFIISVLMQKAAVFFTHAFLIQYKNSIKN